MYRKNNNASESANEFTGAANEVRLIVLAPGHFHANLLQKNEMMRVSDSVFVYASEQDAGLQQYMAAIDSYNQRADDPTDWHTSVYTGEDFIDRMVSEKRATWWFLQEIIAIRPVYTQFDRSGPECSFRQAIGY